MSEQLNTVTDGGGIIVNMLSSGNFLVSIILGGSMQQLWGLIRSMQFLILGFLIRIPLPGHAYKFFEGCALIAQLDIFDGKSLY